MATTTPIVRSEGRVPPHDLEAEQAVIGSILIDPAAVTLAIDIVEERDFYRENHGQMYRAALDLFKAGEPIDNVTMADQLTRMGVLERVGGRVAIALLQESVPTAANIEYYARIVKDRAQKRRLISAGASVTSLGFDDALAADEALNEAQRAVYEIADQRVTTSLESLYPLLKQAMERVESQMVSGTGVLGVPSGFHDLDRMTGGFKGSDLIVVAGRPAMGKALALDTPIPTPDGWRTMGALRVGDQVFDQRGLPCTVTRATPVMHGHVCFEVCFGDGERIVADADHLWSVRMRAAGKRRDQQLLLSTRDMAESLRAAGRPEYSIATCDPLRYPERELPVRPYALGAWLGDGDGSGAYVAVPVAAGHPDGETGEAFAAALGSGPGARSLEVGEAGLPRPLGVQRDAHIPRAYLEASIDQRLSLLQGLMDSRGSIDALGDAEFVSRGRRLAEGALELVRGLGLEPAWSEDPPSAPAGEEGPRCRVRFKPSALPLFRTPGKLAAQRAIRELAAGERRIVEIRPVASVPVRCISVDSPDHLYLAGRACIPTHNTSWALNVALHAAVHNKVAVAVFSLEMSKEQLVERLLCQQAQIDSQRMHRGLLSDREFERLVSAIGPLENAPIFIDESPVLDELTLMLKARQAKQRENIGMIIIDYLQLMRGRVSRDDNRVQEVSSISRSLKGLARELKVPVIALSQLSRAPEARPNKRPMLSDLRESGSIEQDSDVVVFLYRDEYYNDKTDEPGIAEVIVAKHRNGPTGTVKLRFRKDQTLFYNLEQRRATAVDDDE